MKETLNVRVLDVWVIMPKDDKSLRSAYDLHFKGPVHIVDNKFFDLYDDAVRYWRRGGYDLTGYAVRPAMLTMETDGA